MNRCVPATLLGLSLGAGFPAAAQIEALTVDFFDPSDPGYEAPPGRRLIVDVHIDVATTDVFTAAGIRFATTSHASLVYGAVDDPNNSQPDQMLNPGFANRFTTSLSKPRPNRNGVARFENAGVAVAGRYSHPGPVAAASSSELNVAYFAGPPEGPNSPSVDGYIARIAVEPGPEVMLLPGIFEVRITQNPIFSSWILGSFEPEFADDAPGIGVATYDDPRVVGDNWFLVVQRIPEPATWALAVVLGLVIRRR